MQCLSIAQEVIAAAGPESHKTWLYVGFIALVMVFLAIDLGVFHRKAHTVSAKEGLAWTGVWVTVALLFTGVIYFIYQNHWLGIGLNVPQHVGDSHDVGGIEASKLFLTGWIIEYSLSVDNIFVIALIFRFFGVPALYQHRVLFWGIMGALIMRGVMIWIGAAAIQKWEWLLYVFGGILVLTAARLIFASDKEPRPDQNPLVRLARVFFPVSQAYDGQKFFTRIESGRLAMTPLFLVLLVVESTDVVFAVDSIPAIFSITLDPFIIFTSNVFAILGLRSLYFALAGLMNQFRYLKYSLAFILGFVGVKMILVAWHIKVPTEISLGVIVAALATGIIASIVAARREVVTADSQGPAA